MSSVTRPDADQIKFTSSKTGEWNLEEYIQNAEFGNRTLAALLGDVFNTSGAVKLSSFADAAAAAASATAAATSATNASTSQTAAAGSATSAASQVSSAAAQATAAAASATAAAASAITANTKASDSASSASAALTSQIAAAGSVTTAAGSVTAAAGSATAAAGSATAASGSATAAANSATASAASASTATIQAGAASTSATIALGAISSVSDVSSTSLLIGTGSKSLTVSAGKAFAAGHTIKVAQTSNAAVNTMVGTVTSYNSGTGALVFTSSIIGGSGTYTDWTVTITTSGSVAPGSSTPTTNGTAAAGTSLAYSREDHVHGSDATRAPLASPTFTGTVTAPTFSGALSGNASSATTAGSSTTAGSATNSTNSVNVAVTDDVSTNATVYPVFATASSGNNAPKVSSTKLTFNASTGILYAAGGFLGNVTGNVSGSSASCTGNAATATTAASSNALNSANSYSAANLTLSAGLTLNTSAASFGVPMYSGSALRGYLYADSTGIGFLSSAGAWALKLLYGTNNVVSTGDVSGFSDERLKKDWRNLRVGFVTLLAQVKMGVYERTDVKATQVGVSAQSLQEILPEAVHEGEDGILSVSYGNAALAACVALAREIELLKAEIKTLRR